MKRKCKITSTLCRSCVMNCSVYSQISCQRPPSLLHAVQAPSTGSQSRTRHRSTSASTSRPSRPSQSFRRKNVCHSPSAPDSHECLADLNIISARILSRNGMHVKVPQFVTTIFFSHPKIKYHSRLVISWVNLKLGWECWDPISTLPLNTPGMSVRHF